jgi:7,8-dihydropterin-6-yl-methyl-4-(beta-D-ribofuranosyl)aminobenzene 5'-phosphate synthase
VKLQPVDSCDVDVLVDNVMDILSTAPSSVTGHIQNVFKAGATELSGKCLCCAHWGLSLVISVKQGTAKRTLLFDSGPEGDTVKRNGNRLGIDFASIEAAMFSHGHWDHVGGMTAGLKLIYEANGGLKIPVHVNDEMFVRRGIRTADDKVIPFENLPSKIELEEFGGSIVSIAEEHTLLEDTFYISGEIPRVTAYEKGLPGHVKNTGKGWEPDPLIMDERYTAVHIKDKGIMVFTACSHAGVINVLKNARDVFDSIPLYGVMGGFHLSGKECEVIIPETIEDIKSFGLKVIVPGHCTGWRAVHKLVEAFGDETVIMSAVGNTHRF